MKRARGKRGGKREVFYGEGGGQRSGLEDVGSAGQRKRLGGKAERRRDSKRRKGVAKVVTAGSVVHNCRVLHKEEA